MPFSEYIDPAGSLFRIVIPKLGKNLDLLHTLKLQDIWIFLF